MKTVIIYLAMLIILPLMLTGCTTPDKLMARSGALGTEDEAESIKYLIEYASNKGNEAGLRCWALRSASRMKRVDLDSIKKVGDIVTDTKEDSKARAWAAIALGEWRRKEAVAYFIKAFSGSWDPVVGYFILEGMAHNLPSILQDTELNEQVVRSMNKMAAGQRADLPSMFDLVDEYAANLSVLIVVLDKTLSEKNKSKKQKEEIYAAVVRMLTAIEMAKSSYLSSFNDNKTSMEQAFDLAFKSVGKGNRPIFLFIAWNAGYLADNKEFSDIVAGRIVEWIKTSDRRARLTLVWALNRMAVYQNDVTKALIKKILLGEKDENALDILGILANEDDKPDSLQKLLGVETGGGAVR